MSALAACGRPPMRARDCAKSRAWWDAHLVGPHADEVFNLFGLAIRHNLSVNDLKTTMFAYPTGASDIGYML
jgi:pyruvate/2-oxoglutarate dehydrogenase complex dihydrolipoamide dehydrogenase (E3) component